MFSDLFKRNAFYHEYDTRNAELLTGQEQNTARSGFTIKLTGPTVWNSIPGGDSKCGKSTPIQDTPEETLLERPPLKSVVIVIGSCETTACYFSSFCVFNSHFIAFSNVNFHFFFNFFSTIQLLLFLCADMPS